MVNGVVNAAGTHYVDKTFITDLERLKNTRIGEEGISPALDYIGALKKRAGT